MLGSGIRAARAVTVPIVCLLGLAASDARAQNLLSNPSFAADLAEWQEAHACDGTAAAAWASAGQPAGGGRLSCTADSPSLGDRNRAPWVTIDMGGTIERLGLPISARLQQCVPVTGGIRHDIGADCRLNPEQKLTGSDVVVGGGATACYVAVDFYVGADCGGEPTQESRTPGVEVLDEWRHTAIHGVLVPMTMSSAQVRIVAEREASDEEVNATFDNVYLRPAAARGDFNNDGHSDLVLRSASEPEHRIWLMNGAMKIAEAPVTPNPSAILLLKGVADIDDDGDADLVFRNENTGGVHFWLMNGAIQTGHPSLSGAAAPTLDWDLAATGDFDSDSLPDLLWRNQQTQKLAIWLMNGHRYRSTLLPTPDQAVNSNWSVVAAVDYDANGTTDLLWYNATSGKLVQWLMDEDVVRTVGRFTDPPNAGNNNWKVVASADYGSDSERSAYMNDVVWRNETSGKLVLWRLDANGVRTSGAFLTPDSPTPALSWTVVGPR